MNYADILENEPNTFGGVSFQLYWALWDWVLTWPTVAPTPTELSEEIEYVDDIVFKTGFQFHVLQINQNTSQNIITPTGDAQNIMFQNRITINKSGIPKDFLAWVNHVKNKSMVLLAQDLCGEMRMIGNQCNPAKMYPEGEFNSGTPGNSKNSQVVIGNDGLPAYYYPGAIPLTPAI